ncbi:MAG TPA: HEAT repeat domain-containing protein, partial [Bryobacteraceae bacterium]|nr:HEAT repeat domain-containing protein [Bryobacteraceae bacterium]
MNAVRWILSFSLAAGTFAQTPAGKPEQSRQILEDALQDKNPDTRKQAVMAMSLAASREPFLSRLQSMLKDNDVEVRIAVISSMVDIRDKRTLISLHDALNDEVPEVAFAAARALRSLNDPAGKEALLSILSGESKASSGF